MFTTSVTQLWEEQRFRRASTGLMRGEMLSALKYFFGQISSEGHLRKVEEPTKRAFAYFSANPKEREKVISLLARYGITPAVLQAKAAQLNGDAYADVRGHDRAASKRAP